MSGVDDLEAAVERDDEQLKEDLPGTLEGVESDLETLLVERPETFRALVSRVATVDGPAEFARDEPETVERFFAIVWGGLELISETVPSVGEEIDDEFAVQWDPEDADVRWYAETDPVHGTISGGPGELESPDVTFAGDTGALFRMLGDDEFDPQQAFMRGEYQIDGQLPVAVRFGETMDAVTTALEEVESSI